MQSPNAPIEAFGGGLAARPLDLGGVQQVAVQQMQERQRIALEEQRRADQIAVTHAVADASFAKTSWLQDAFSRKGQDAFVDPEITLKGLGEVYGQIRERLTTREQQDAFDRYVAGDLPNVDAQVQRHVAQQREVYDKAGYEAAKDALTIEAVNSVQDVPTSEAAIAKLQAVAIDRARRLGLPQEAVDLRAQEEVSHARLAVLRQLPDLQAEAYYNAHQKEFVGPDADHAQNIGQEGSVVAESQRASDAILKKTQDEREAMKLVMEMPPGKVREKAMHNVSEYFNQLDGAKNRAHKEALDTARGLFARWDTEASYDRLPYSIRQKLTGTDEENLRDDAKKRQNPVIHTKTSLFTDLFYQATLNDSTRQEFAKLDLTDPKYRENLSNTDYARLSNMQRQIRGGASAGTRPDRSMMGREETAVISEAKAAIKADRPMNMPIFPWQIDSAMKSVPYRDHLRAFGVPIDAAIEQRKLQLDLQQAAELSKQADQAKKKP